MITTGHMDELRTTARDAVAWLGPERVRDLAVLAVEMVHVHAATTDDENWGAAIERLGDHAPSIAIQLHRLVELGQKIRYDHEPEHEGGTDE